MNFVNAYGYDRDTGQYTGIANAWESPLEQGVFMLPANATFEAPPDIPEDMYASWTGTSWELLEIPLPPAPEPPTIEDVSADVRIERNGKLNACDWTQLPDVPMDAQTRAAWAIYRQALRDVPQQGGFPNTVIWPTAPGA